MSYVAWSVVFGEQPTAAKWNILGTNDESFHDGTGIDDDVILERHIAAGTLIENTHYQTDNNNSISSTLDAKIQFQAGWAQELGNNTTSMTAAVTFPTPFTTVLGIITQLNAVKATTPATSILDLNAVYNTGGQTFTVSAGTMTTSGFTANLSRSTNNFGSTTYYGFSWLAWGII